MKTQRLLLCALPATLLLSACNTTATEDKKTAVASVQSETTAASALPVISPQLPADGQFNPPFDLASLQHDFDVFSWQSFIALNWPAAAIGQPDTSVSIGEKQGQPTVWQTYKESRDIFLPGGATPPAWGTDVPPPSVCGDQSLPVLSQIAKVPNVLDESAEPFETGPLIDQNGQYTRYEILTNEIMFNYIRQNQLYSAAGQAAFGGNADFPFGTDSQVGSIMLKASWKVLGANDDATRFHTAQAYVYNNPDEHAGVTAACKLQTVGLVGFHIGTKMSGNPQWVWSTFEHADNVPTKGEPISKAHYNYYKPNCTDCAEVNAQPPRPWNPGNAFTQPSQIMRVIPVTADTRQLNASYHAALEKLVPGSVWTHYELVSTQWPTDPNSKTDPTGVPAPSFLANTTLETYIQGEVRQTSSSCIQCHNNATMTSGKFSDFTYLLQRAQ
jgi:hypothetical protein